MSIFEDLTSGYSACQIQAFLLPCTTAYAATSCLDMLKLTRLFTMRAQMVCLVTQALDDGNSQGDKGTKINRQASQSVVPKPLVERLVGVSGGVVRANSFLGRDHEGHEDEMRDCQHRSGAVPCSCRAAASIEIGDGGHEGQGDGGEAPVKAGMRDGWEVGGQGLVAVLARRRLVQCGEEEVAVEGVV